LSSNATGWGLNHSLRSFAVSINIKNQHIDNGEEWKVIEVGHHERVGAIIEMEQINGWKFHSYHPAG